MNRISMWMCKLYVSKMNKSEYLKQLKILSGLYPGQDKEELIRNYYIQKIQKVLLVVCGFIVLLTMLAISEYTDSVIDDSNRIVRNETDGLTYEAQLIAQVEEEQYKINVAVLNQKYTKEEADKLYKDLSEKLKTLILGENESLEHITNDLNLVNSVEGYPFDLSWETDNYELIYDNGKLVEEPKDEEGTEVNLRCNLTYEEFTYEQDIGIVIFPKELTENERIEKEIIASIQEKQIETQNEKYLQLPTSIGEKGISWRKSPSSTGVIVAILACITSIGIWWGVDNDLTNKYKKRDQLLRLDYSEFVSKLQLLISSGMTLRGALERMEADYKLSLKNGEEKRYVYEELSICLKRLRDGASETEIYIMFGNRCGQLAYKKLMSLLVQNLKKGNSGLMVALNYEAKAAFEERKHIARRLGEEAQTKLLLPMTLMLGIVMVIILIPAYFSFAM